MLQCF
jgi:ferredoxin-2, mitochondrial